ncbi:MAG: putative metal-binding motif-containing protein [Myxococcales bacterium]|nr:putative metal-binding motif-containing protein [Myxococcales bacterium]
MSPRLSLALLLTAACASGAGGASDGGARHDGGVSDAGARDGAMDARTDAPMMELDAGPGDAGPTCDDVMCGPWERCVAGECLPYPDCVDVEDCDGEIVACRNGRCLPCDVDIDGDGYGACEDCDETNPNVNPGVAEVCNGVDDNCSGTADDGDPAAMCVDLGGGECIDGGCGCPMGTWDIDPAVPGCECVAAPDPAIGVSCAGAINLGDLADDGAVSIVSGNVMPADRELWYRFRGVDSVDTSCDNFHVRVRFTENPDDTFEFTTFRGGCATPQCADAGFTDYRWATDFRASIGGRLSGQCPCTAPGATRLNNVSVCTNDTAEFFVRVRRRDPGVESCPSFTLEVSNGLYDS